MLLEISLSAVDPNTLVGWVSVLGVTAAALYKVGRWIVDLRGDIGRALDILETTQTQLVRHDRQINFIWGVLGLNHEDSEDKP